MRTRSVLAIVPLLLSGCLSPVTSRLDQANCQLEAANRSLALMHDELMDTSQKLAKVQAALEQMDRRLAVVERVVKKVGGIKDE